MTDRELLSQLKKVMNIYMILEKMVATTIV